MTPAAEFFAARTGEPSARIGDSHIHSRFDPSREADRFLESQITTTPGTLLVLGPGLGYLLRAARAAYPACRLVAIAYTRAYSGRTVATADDSWYPDGPQSLRNFLRSVLSEDQIDGLAMIEWGPSASMFPAVSRTVNDCVAAVVRELSSSLATTGYFGRRWFTNAVANAVSIREVHDHLSMSGTVVIAASGPTLERATPVLIASRDSIGLIALPSAVRPLLEHGIVPDAVVATDPGVYAAVHLAPLSRISGVPVIMPLTGIRGVWRTGSPAILFSQMSFLESAFHGAIEPAVVVPSHGTVAGSAYHVAVAAGADRIVFAGLDMAAHDVKMHARPESFEGLLSMNENRLQTAEGIRLERVLGSVRGPNRSRVTPSMDVYAAWFRETRLRAARLFPSPIDLGIPDCTPDDLTTGPRGSIQISARRRLAPTRRRVMEILRTWRAELIEARDTDPLPPVARELVRIIEMPLWLTARRSVRAGDTDAGRTAVIHACDAAARFVADCIDRLESQ